MLLETELAPNPIIVSTLVKTHESSPESRTPEISGYNNDHVSEQAPRMDRTFIQISQEYITGLKYGVFARPPWHLSSTFQPVTRDKGGFGILSEACQSNHAPQMMPRCHTTGTQYSSQGLPQTPSSGGQNAHQRNETQTDASSCNHTSGPSKNAGYRSLDSDEEPPPSDRPILFRSFNPYDQPKSTRRINEAIKVELLKPHPAAQGFIYGFAHPDNVLIRLGTGPIIETELVKIGRSDNVVRRMQQWRKQCKYNPRLMFAHAMFHHQRIERVIHHQLHNSRLREYLGCSGCGVRHTEWFRAEAQRAESLVVMWQGFTEQQPYGEAGDMSAGWLERLEQVDLDNLDCWSWFTSGPPLTKAASSHEPAQRFENDTGTSTELIPSSSNGETVVRSIG